MRLNSEIIKIKNLCPVHLPQNLVNPTYTVGRTYHFQKHYARKCMKAWKMEKYRTGEKIPRIDSYCTKEFIMLQAVSQAQTPSWPECQSRYSKKILDIFRLLNIADTKGIFFKAYLWLCETYVLYIHSKVCCPLEQ